MSDPTAPPVPDPDEVPPLTDPENGEAADGDDADEAPQQ